MLSSGFAYEIFDPGFGSCVAQDRLVLLSGFVYEIFDSGFGSGNTRPFSALKWVCLRDTVFDSGFGSEKNKPVKCS